MIESDDKEMMYHTDEGTCEPLLDERGDKIPLEICICFAKEPSECCCQCNSWGNFMYDDDCF